VRRPKRSTTTSKTGRYSTRKADDEEVTFYVQDDWQDLCQGPHVEPTGEKIRRPSWRSRRPTGAGDEDNDTLTRVYGTAFASESDLKEHLELREEALERDHRKIGQEMNLLFDPDGDRSRPPAVPPAGQDRAP